MSYFAEVLCSPQEKSTGALAQQIVRDNLPKLPGHVADELQDGVSPLSRQGEEGNGFQTLFGLGSRLLGYMVERYTARLVCYIT